MSFVAVDCSRLRNILLLLLAFAFCLYLPTVFHEIFSDDEIYMAYSNRFLRESPWSDLYLLFVKPANPWEFLPLRDFTYWLDFRVWGDEPNGFHVTNLLWYAASGLACFWFLREIILYCRPDWAAQCGVLALSGTLLFVVHPAHVEVVAWIASRKDLIAGTLFFLSAAVLIRALGRGWHWREMLLAALLLFAACFGKAAAMTGIVFITVMIGSGWNASPGISLGRKTLCLLVFLGLAAAAFVIHLNVGADTGIRVENHPGAWLMLDRASRILTTLLGIALLPYPLRFYYDVYFLGSWHWLVSLGTLALLVLALRELSLRRSLWAFGVVLLFCPLLIYLQLIPFSTWSLASERFTFVAIAGLALLLVDLLGRLENPAKILAVMLVIVLPSAAVVWQRVANWGEPPIDLLSREYVLEPIHHHAIRDRIVLVLLPQKRYGEAEALIRQLPRAYIVEAWLALIAAEQSFLQISEAGKTKSPGDRRILRLSFCGALENLRLASAAANALIAQEPDVSYNNMVRSLDRSLKHYVDDAALSCPVPDGS